MKHYRDETRGTFQNEQEAKQLISFEGMKYKGRNGVYNVTPTDVDGALEFEVENCFIFFELKRYGELLYGQKKFYMRLVDTLCKGGADSILFVSQHNADKGKTIIAKKSVVKQIYWRGKWYDIHDRCTLGECVGKYLSHLHTDANMLEELAS